jgi:hypothetical protein
VRRDAEEHPERNPVTRLVSRIFPVAIDHAGKGFFIQQAGRWMITPMLLALVTVDRGVD